MTINITPVAQTLSSTGGSQEKPNMVVLNDLIASGKTINYKGQDFKNRNNVALYVNDHKALNTAMLGTEMYLYQDPCDCCLPAHGVRDYKPDISDATRVIDYVRKKNDSGTQLDILFTSYELYTQVKVPIAQISQNTKIIVACNPRSSRNASELRKQNIPAIDENDYLRASPLNAVIALTVFDELMTA